MSRRPPEHRLPLVAPHEREHTYCALCPKLCRHSCPVATVEARETTTPWAKMTSLHHTATGALAPEASFAATWYACTGCMRCKTWCDHDNEVADALAAGRAEAVRAGVAPRSAREAIDDHPVRERRAAESARALFGDGGQGEIAFVPGCTACVRSPDVATAGRAAVEALLRRPARVVADVCCGLPLLEAGDRDGFLDSANAMLRRLAGASEVVFLDPGCQHVLTVRGPALGLEAPPPSRHVSQVAAGAIDALGPIDLRGPVRYHDACRLGRGLGIFEEPRAVLARLLGRPADELPHARDRAECSGAGGQLPRTSPRTSEAIADELHDRHGEAGGGTLVTACPAAARRLSERGRHRVIDLVTLLSRALAARRADAP